MHIKTIKKPTATNKRGQTALNRYPESAQNADEHISCIFDNTSGYQHAADAQLVLKGKDKKR